MPLRDASGWDENLLRQFEAFERRLREAEEWIEDMTPTMSAVAQLIRDAEYGRRARDEAERRWERRKQSVVAAVAAGTLVLAFLKAIGVL